MTPKFTIVKTDLAQLRERLDAIRQLWREIEVEYRSPADWSGARTCHLCDYSWDAHDPECLVWRLQEIVEGWDG